MTYGNVGYDSKYNKYDVLAVSAFQPLVLNLGEGTYVPSTGEPALSKRLGRISFTVTVTEN